MHRTLADLRRSVRNVGAIVALLVLIALLSSQCDRVRAEEKAPTKTAATTDSLRGRIVWLGEAMKRRHGIETDADALRATIALETSNGELIPIVKDARGRAFHLDPRLHKFDYELTVRRYPGLPAVQIVEIYTWHEGRKYLFDYWCDICAIPMYELKDCECCQGPIRFRERLIGPAGPGAERMPGEAR